MEPSAQGQAALPPSDARPATGTGEAIWYLDLPGHGAVPYEPVAFDTSLLEVGSSPEELWRWQAPTDQAVFVGAVGADTVYATSNDGNVYAIDRASGEGRLLLDTDGQVGALATLAGDTLYVASSDRHVYAIDRHTGEPAWVVAVPGEPAIPVVSDGWVIVGTNLDGSSPSPTPARQPSQAESPARLVSGPFRWGGGPPAPSRPWRGGCRTRP
jgi:outer membrane protein assembly factor BamB